jgi:hypothetical protein
MPQEKTRAVEKLNDLFVLEVQSGFFFYLYFITFNVIKLCTLTFPLHPRCTFWQKSNKNGSHYFVKALI